MLRRFCRAVASAFVGSGDQFTTPAKIPWAVAAGKWSILWCLAVEKIGLGGRVGVSEMLCTPKPNGYIMILIIIPIKWL